MTGGLPTVRGPGGSETGVRPCGCGVRAKGRGSVEGRQEENGLEAGQNQNLRSRRVLLCFASCWCGSYEELRDCFPVIMGASETR